MDLHIEACRKRAVSLIFTTERRKIVGCKLWGGLHLRTLLFVLFRV